MNSVTVLEKIGLYTTENQPIPICRMLRAREPEVRDRLCPWEQPREGGGDVRLVDRDLLHGAGHRVDEVVPRLNLH